MKPKTGAFFFFFSPFFQYHFFIVVQAQWSFKKIDEIDKLLARPQEKSEDTLTYIRNERGNVTADSALIK